VAVSAHAFDAAADEEVERRAAERSSGLLAERQKKGFRGDISELAHVVTTERSEKLLPLLTSRATTIGDWQSAIVLKTIYGFGPRITANGPSTRTNRPPVLT
jgi:hypothetical protein